MTKKLKAPKAPWIAAALAGLFIAGVGVAQEAGAPMKSLGGEKTLEQTNMPPEADKQSVAMGGFPVDGQSKESFDVTGTAFWPGFSRPRQLLAFARLITNVTKLRLDPSTVPVTSQHPSVGKMTPVAWKPLNP